jgi:hypothetical protein
VGAGLSGPAAKRMWGIYADTSLDASGLDRAKMKGLNMWLVMSSKGEAIAMIGVSLAEESRFYISPQYVVFAQASLKVAPDGPFATFLFPAALRDLSVSRNGAKVESGMSEEAQGVAFRFEKVARNDLIEWEVTGAKAAKGSVRPILLGAEAGFVEYIVAIPGGGAASRPATK